MGLLEDGKRPARSNGRKPALNNDLLEDLTQEEIDALKAQAREQVDAERKAKAKDAVLAHLVEEERRSREPTKEIRSIFLDLAPHTQFIMIDGKQYFHAFSYDVPLDVYETLQEMMARGWAHEEQCGEPNRKYYRRPPYIGTQNFQQHPLPRDLTLSPRNANVPASQLLKV